MAYEEMTYERIMSRCLARVPGTVDKREGSIIYDAIARQQPNWRFFTLTRSTQMDRAFPDTAADVDLTNKAKERGVFRLPASAAVRKGVFKGAAGYMDIPIGSRFSGGTVNYRATRKESWCLSDDLRGHRGDRQRLLWQAHVPITYIAGLTSAELQDILIPGEDEESDEELRARYMQSLSNTAFGGNVAEYKQQIEQIEGVGAAKIFPVWAVRRDGQGGADRIPAAPCPPPSLSRRCRPPLTRNRTPGRGWAWRPSVIPLPSRQPPVPP